MIAVFIIKNFVGYNQVELFGTDVRLNSTDSLLFGNKNSIGAFNLLKK